MALQPQRASAREREKKVLAKLKQVLQLRPQPILEIPPASALDDITALKTKVVKQTSKAALELKEESHGLVTTRHRGVLDNFYLASSLTTSLTEIERRHTASADAASDTSPALDIIAYNNDLRDLKDHDASELQALAAARANCVSSFC